MSRMSGGQPIEVRPTNNVYTVLVAVALVVQLVGLIALMTRATGVFGDSLFFPNNPPPRATSAR